MDHLIQSGISFHISNRTEPYNWTVAVCVIKISNSFISTYAHFSKHGWKILLLKNKHVEHTQMPSHSRCAGKTTKQSTSKHWKRDLNKMFLIATPQFDSVCEMTNGREEKCRMKKKNFISHFDRINNNN